MNNMKLIKFYSKTCGPCKILEKNLKWAKVEYISVDISSTDGEFLCTKYDVRSVLTLVLLNDKNELIKKNTGILNVEQIKHFVDKY